MFLRCCRRVAKVSASGVGACAEARERKEATSTKASVVALMVLVV